MKRYFNHQVNKAIVIQNLITIESLDVTKEFTYPEENHTFHEFVYVDNGNIHCCLEGEDVELMQGDFLLIPPLKRHFYYNTEEFSAALFIVCFRCRAEILSILEQKIPLSKELKSLLADIVQESKNAFQFPFNRKLKPLDNPLYASQQLVENNIEKLLIHLVRNETNQNESIKFVMDSVEKEYNLIDDILSLLNNNLYSKITLEYISQQTYYSKAYLNSIFNKHMGTSIMQYYNTLKIKEAKKLLRNEQAPSSIALQLGFESATYFTKAFKKQTGMTPSAYKKQILK